MGHITVTPDDYYSPNTPGQGYMKQGTIAVGTKKAGYCNNNGYCEATEADSCGDCDGDGELTVKDALTAIQMSVVKLAVDMCYDYNGDGKVDSSDAREMLKAIGADQ